RLYGYSRAQMVGRTARDLDIWVHPAERDLIIAQLHAVKVIDDIRTEFRRPDGQVIHVRLAAAEIEINGAPHVLGLAQDISELHVYQERLHELLVGANTLGAAAPLSRPSKRDEGQA